MTNCKLVTLNRNSNRNPQLVTRNSLSEAKSAKTDNSELETEPATKKFAFIRGLKSVWIFRAESLISGAMKTERPTLEYEKNSGNRDDKYCGIDEAGADAGRTGRAAALSGKRRA
jgi:hypothetical protein